MRKPRIGMLGGTFDPVHYAHLRVAEEAVERLSLDRLLMVLSATPPHKAVGEVTSFDLRWEMLCAACRGNPRFEPCDMERERTGPSYTVDTLREIRKRFGEEAEVHLIVGLDCAVEFTTWRDFEKILAENHLIVFGRAGEEVERIPEAVRRGMTLLDWEGMGHSSTSIRRLAAEGRSIRYLIPPEVEAIIHRESLYRDSGLPRRVGKHMHPSGEVCA